MFVVLKDARLGSYRAGTWILCIASGPGIPLAFGHHRWVHLVLDIIDMILDMSYGI